LGVRTEEAGIAQPVQGKRFSVSFPIGFAPAAVLKCVRRFLEEAAGRKERRNFKILPSKITGVAFNRLNRIDHFLNVGDNNRCRRAPMGHVQSEQPGQDRLSGGRGCYDQLHLSLWNRHPARIGGGLLTKLNIFKKAIQRMRDVTLFLPILVGNALGERPQPIRVEHNIRSGGRIEGDGIQVISVRRGNLVRGVTIPNANDPFLSSVLETVCRFLAGRLGGVADRPFGLKLVPEVLDQGFKRLSAVVTVAFFLGRIDKPKVVGPVFDHLAGQSLEPVSGVNRRRLPEHERGELTLHGGRLLVPPGPRRQQSGGKHRGIPDAGRVEVSGAEQEREKTRELCKVHAGAYGTWFTRK
jgi:hypothetical protein